MLNKDSETIMKKISTFLTVVFLASTLVGCNTLAGIGKDISGIGNGLTGASDKIKNDLTKERN
ncbi:MAG: putative small secreted protein [Lysobacterales bacterium]|jgi:predicted small secreted protein